MLAGNCFALQAELGAAMDSETKDAMETTAKDKQGITHLGLRLATLLPDLPRHFAV